MREKSALQAEAPKCYVYGSVKVLRFDISCSSDKLDLASDSSKASFVVAFAKVIPADRKGYIFVTRAPCLSKPNHILHNLAFMFIDFTRWHFSTHMIFCISSNKSKNASRSISTFCSPRPTTTVLVSSGFLVAITLAIWLAYKWPIVSRCSPPAPRSVLGVKCPSGSMSSFSEGRAVSKAVGEADESGTWIWREC